MKPSYLEGMLVHLLADADDVTAVETFTQAGAVGEHWPPHGVKVTFTDRSVAFLACSRTSTPGEDLAGQPDVFDPEVLHVPSVRG